MMGNHTGFYSDGIVGSEFSKLRYQFECGYVAKNVLEALAIWCAFSAVQTRPGIA